MPAYTCRVRVVPVFRSSCIFGPTWYAATYSFKTCVSDRLRFWWLANEMKQRVRNRLSSSNGRMFMTSESMPRYTLCTSGMETGLSARALATSFGTSSSRCAA